MATEKLNTNQMLFKVTDAQVIDDNPNLSAIPELSELSDRNLKWVLLVFDYETPFKQLPIDERKVSVANHVGFHYEKDGKRFDKNARDIIAGNADSVNRAIAKFRELQYDENKETLASIRELIDNIRTFIRDKSTAALEYEKKVKMAQSLPGLEETKKRLSQILGIREEEEIADTENKEPLSTLDLINEGSI